MTFIVPIMVLGVAAAIIPLIIHLRNRSRFQVVHWGAMHLLESVLRINRRRIRIEQIILLIIRMAIPAIIALFMARPVLTGWRALPGNDAKSSLVVAIDNSYSMDAGGGSQSAFSKSLRAAEEVLAELPRGSDAAAVPLSAGSDAELAKPTVDVRHLRKQLQDLPGGMGIARPAAAIDTALAAFAGMNNADRELLMISDFQRLSWSGESAAGLRRAAAALQSAAVKPHVTLLRCAAESVDNASVDSVQFSRFIVGVGQKAQIRAVVRNRGQKPRSGLRVRLRVDGQDRETTEIAVGAGEQTQVIFTHTFDQPGSHYLEVASDGDALMADNSLLAAVPVWGRIPVLLVNGEPSREALRGETDYLEVALTPFTAGSTRLADLITTRVMAPDGLDPAALTSARVAVLANIGALKPAQTAALEDFVRSGGGLLFFTGSKLDVGWYNAAWAATDKSLMPLRLRAPAGSLSEHDRQTTLIGEHFDHEALALFNAPENGTIGGAEVWMWHPPDDRDALQNTGRQLTVLARLANGDPFLVEHKYGEGRVIFCASACDADWGNLPMRPAYVPFIQQLVTNLASTVYPPRNVEVGGELAVFLPLDQAGAELNLKLPDGSARKITAVSKGPRAVAAWPAAQRPGLYVLQGKGVAPIHFAVNTSREESDLAALSDQELTEVAAILHADLVKSGAEYGQLQQRRRSGREIWRYFFGAALVLVLLEMVLEQRFARRAR